MKIRSLASAFLILSLLISGCTIGRTGPKQSMQKIFHAAQNWQSGLSKEEKTAIRKDYFADDYAFVKTMVALGIGERKQKVLVKEELSGESAKLFYKFIPSEESARTKSKDDPFSQTMYFVFHLRKKGDHWTITNLQGALKLEDLH